METAVTVKLINDTEETQIVKLEWINHPYGCWFTYGFLHCEYYIAHGTLYVNGKTYERGNETWVGKPWIFNWKRDGYAEIGNIYRIHWENGVVHDFTITKDLTEVISRASEAWLNKK